GGRRGGSAGGSPTAGTARGSGPRPDRLRGANATVGIARLPDLLCVVPAAPLRAHRPEGPGRQLQCDPQPPALQPGRGDRVVESLRGGRHPLPTAPLPDPDLPVGATLRPLDDELRRAGDAWLERDLGL